MDAGSFGHGASAHDRVHNSNGFLIGSSISAELANVLKGNKLHSMASRFNIYLQIVISLIRIVDINNSNC